ncbi:hypothetical protein Hanom_Chr16g01463861 [Helianthus anomalus]
MLRVVIVGRFLTEGGGLSPGEGLKLDHGKRPDEKGLKLEGMKPEGLNGDQMIVHGFKVLVV